MLGEVIRIIKIANDMDSSVLSKKSTISKSYITEIEQGKKIPSEKTLIRLCQAFNIDIQDLQDFDKIHNTLLANKEELYAYRTLLMCVLSYYENQNSKVKSQKKLTPR